MPLTVKKLSDRLVPMEIDIDGDKLHVVYRPSVMTPAMEDELGKLSQSKQWAPLASKLVAKWDLMEADGKTEVPLTEKRLYDLDVPFLQHVCMEISRDMGPNRRTAERSGGGSLAADS